jgi:hypothetical protein
MLADRIIAENGGGAGVRLMKKPKKAKGPLEH